MKILQRSIPLWMLLLIMATIGLGIIVFLRVDSNYPKKVSAQNVCESKVIYTRGKKGKLSRQLIMADSPDESSELGELKSTFQQTISSSIAQGGVKNASVYYRQLNSGKWISINGDQQFSAASIMKVLTLMYHLREEENKPGWLNQKMLVASNLTGSNIQTATDKHTKIGSTYTIKELIDFMILYSDNNATAHLNSLMDFNVYSSLMSDINIPIPDKNQTDYKLTSEQTSRFLTVLYNCSVLSSNYSEMALKILTKSSYHGGLLRNIKKNVIVAHKFGERFLPNENQIHETAIFYLNEDPYLLTVMTTGSDTAQEADLLGKIGSIAFDYSNKNN
jgi:beta-lactamase class A